MPGESVEGHFTPTMVIFCCGVITGALVGRTGMRPASPPRPVSLYETRDFTGSNMLHRLDRELNLTTNQHEQVERVIRESQERIKLLMDEIEPRLQKEFDRVHQEIRDELSPAQDRKYLADLNQSHPRRGEGPPPREGGPYRGRGQSLRRPQWPLWQCGSPAMSAAQSSNLPATAPGMMPPVQAPAMSVTNAP